MKFLFEGIPLLNSKVLKPFQDTTLPLGFGLYESVALNTNTAHILSTYLIEIPTKCTTNWEWHDSPEVGCRGPSPAHWAAWLGEAWAAPSIGLYSACLLLVLPFTSSVLFLLCILSPFLLIYSVISIFPHDFFSFLLVSSNLMSFHCSFPRLYECLPSLSCSSYPVFHFPS